MIFDDVLDLEVKAMEVLGDSKEKHIILHNCRESKIENQQSVLKL